MRRRVALWWLLGLSACSARRLPPGTPPPEYEPPVVSAWPPDAAVGAQPAPDAALPSASASGADLSPDAGVR
jgi:hypothetical protein